MIGTMRHINCEIEDGLLIVAMSRGKANAINSGMIEELNAALDQARDDQTIRAMVIASNRPGFFSTGFDVKEVFRYDRQTLARFFTRFRDFHEGLRLLTKPVVAALSGHAYAGGAMMSLACDERVFAEGDYGFAVNGINIGITFSPGLVQLAIDGLGLQHGRELLLGAKTFSPREAFRIGIAHELVPPEQTLDQAKARARKLAAKPPSAFAALKRAIVETTSGDAFHREREGLDQFIHQWFLPESERLRQTLVDSLSRE
ncbi:MAG: enoyl-CoA hydratase/isomerase family protein [Acidobacteriota bacterium]